jgi:hypothetical protein
VREHFDQLAKSILGTVLATAGKVNTQEEIVAEVQAADVWFVPTPERAAERARLGLLGRMAETPCLLEPFHATPGGDAVLDCLRKQLTLRHNRLRDARKQAKQEPPATPRQDSGPPESPRLWILSSGRPESVIEDLAFTPLDGPSGVWQAPRLLATFLVVLRDLPVTRDTLALRLLGAGPTFRQAVAELRALPAEDWEADLLIPLLLAFSPQIFQDLQEDPVSYAEIETIFDEWDRRVRGKTRSETLHRALVASYEARFRSIPETLRVAIEAVDDEDTLMRWVVLFTTGSVEEIAAAVLGPADGANGAR